MIRKYVSSHCCNSLSIRCIARSLSTRRVSERDSEECRKRNASSKGTGWKKKKVALVVGYNGSNYHGLQLVDPELNTIEKRLEEALFDLGCILPTNKQKLEKIGWSRSSRTDKGVHAARIVISAKILLDPMWIMPAPSAEDVTNEYPRYPAIVHELNKILPPEIKVFSCVRVNKGFNAREACHWRCDFDYSIYVLLHSALQREYEYLVPPRLASCISTDSDNSSPCASEEDFVQRLNEVFALMEGTKSMHNYHKKKDTKGAMDTPKGYMPAVGKDVHWDYVVGTCKDTNSNDESKVVDNIKPQYFRNWYPRLVNDFTKGSIYKVKAFSSKHPQSSCGMLTIRLRGQGFLLNQIRLMISAAVLYAHDIIPMSVVHLSLDAPFRITFPRAPAEGLLLVDSGYSRNANGQSFTLHPYHLEANSSNDILSFMTKEEYDASELFKRDLIYPDIIDEWKPEGDQDLLKSWISRCQEYIVCDSLKNKFSMFLDEYYAFQSAQMKKKYDVYRRRVDESRELFSKMQKSYSERKDIQKSEMPRPLKDFNKKCPARLFLPNGTTTALIVKYDLLPSGPVITQAVRALAYAVASRKLEPFQNPQHVLQTVTSTDGEIWSWSKDKPQSPLMF